MTDADPARETTLDAAAIADELQKGLALHQSGKVADAEVHYRAVLKADRDHPEANNLLGLVLLNRGEAGPAVRYIAHAVQAKPDNAQYHCNLGVVLNAAGQHERAIQSFGRALELKPDYPEALSNRGMALNHLFRPEQAADSFRQAIALRPGEPGFHLNLGNSLKALGDLREAEASYRRALELRPNYPNAMSALGLVLEEMRRPEESLAASEAAAAAQPKNPWFRRNLGLSYRLAGKIDLAEQNYRKALALAPNDNEFYLLLSHVRVKTAYDDEMAELERRFSAPEATDLTKFQLGLALGRWFEDLGEFDRSFAYFRDGNAAHRRGLAFTPTEARDFGIIRKLFDPMPRDLPPIDRSAPAPIFVVGMPRAGKTTVEKMLGQHPRTRAAGELRVMSLLSRDLSVKHGLSLRGARIGQVPRRELGELGAAYMDFVRHIVPDGWISIDTMPPNFRLVGLIRMALPNARIVHCRREPLEHCVAMFQKRFPQGGYEFTYDLGELAAAYASYRDLVDYWRDSIPGFVHDVDVSELARSEEKARELLDFCGLDWDPACAVVPQSEPRLGGEGRPDFGRVRLGPYESILRPLLAPYLGAA